MLETAGKACAVAGTVTAGTVTARASAFAECTALAPPPARRTQVSTEAAEIAVATKVASRRPFLPINMPCPARKASP
jgi:hypothetical protein